MHLSTSKSEVSDAVPPESSRRRLSLGKKITFCLVPVVILVVLTELVLTVAGFSFRAEDQVPIEPLFFHEGPMIINNGGFPYELTGTYLQTQFFRPEPIPGQIRVALLGGSSVYNLGEKGELDTLLSQFLGQPVDAINFGANGLGSGQVVRSAREAIELHAQVLLVYTGHNEFDQLAVDMSLQNYKRAEPPVNHEEFLAISSSSELPLQAWSRFRTVQLMWKFIRSRVEKEQREFDTTKSSPFGMGRMWTPGEKDLIYRVFEFNLRQIAEMTQENNVMLILSTVAPNLAFPPRVYDNLLAREQLLPDDQKLSEEEIERRANSLDATALELWRWGDILNQRGDKRVAREFFEAALLRNPHPYKADPTINRIIRRVAAQTNTPLIEIPAKIDAAAESLVPGEEMFFDHCHLKREGNLILLETFMDELQSQLQERQAQGP